jgi:hypothetical protein
MCQIRLTNKAHEQALQLGAAARPPTWVDCLTNKAHEQALQHSPAHQAGALALSAILRALSFFVCMDSRTR